MTNDTCILCDAYLGDSESVEQHSGKHGKIDPRVRMLLIVTHSKDQRKRRVRKEQ